MEGTGVDKPIESEEQSVQEVEEEIEEVISRSHEHYREGVQLLKQGMTHRAKKSFDQAIEIYLSSGYNIFDYPSLEESYNEMVEKISEFENTSLKDLVIQDVYESPVDQLGDIDTSISPETAQKEKDLLGNGLESVHLGINPVLNNEVLAFLEYYTQPAKSKFQTAIKRSGAYLDMMKEIFREEGIPEDLVYMAHVESAFKVHAYSRARAKGIWQFIASTARKYGLRVDWWIDERSNPEKSARAAAAYLKDLYGIFGDWYLAMAAYNAGEGKVGRALKRSGKEDFWGIAKTRHIRRETKNYVPAILASILIAKNPKRFGLEENYDPPLEYDKVVVDSTTDLRVIAKCAGTSVQEIKRLNPALYRMQTPPGYTEFYVNIPVGKGEIFSENFAKVPKKDRILYTRHKVRRGETLSTIARKYGTSVKAIQQANNMGRRTLIREKSYLIIPMSSYFPKDFTAQSSKKYKRGEKINYRVRKGDTLYSIARRYNTNVKSILLWNNISESKILYPGNRLTVYAGIRETSDSLSAKAGKRGKKIIYTVRRGDCLYNIARSHKVSIRKLCNWNRISRRTTLYPGNKLTIYLD
jgi:membrane-bound lytic murein transglycosylase D